MKDKTEKTVGTGETEKLEKTDTSTATKKDARKRYEVLFDALSDVFDRFLPIDNEKVHVGTSINARVRDNYYVYRVKAEMGRGGFSIEIKEHKEIV